MIHSKYMIKSDVKITSSLYVKMAILSMPIQEYDRICFFCANNLENICKVCHMFLQYGMTNVPSFEMQTL